MARIFTITTPAETVRVGPDGRASMVFTVTNVSGIPERALVRPVPLGGSTRAEWLSISGESEREFSAGGVQQFTVTASVPPGTPAGRHTWRLDAISARRAGEEREEGPVVALEVAATPPPKKSMSWLWIVIALLVLLLGAIVWWLLGRGKKEEKKDFLAEVPRNGIALWLIGDEARPVSGPGLDIWQNEAFAGTRATAISIAAQPAVITNALNGHTVVRFDGQDDMLRTNVEFGRGRMPAATVFTVFSSATKDSSPLRKLYGCDDGGFDPAIGLDSRTGGVNYGVFTGMGVAPYFDLEATKTYLTADRFQWTSFSGWVNGHATITSLTTNHDTATLPNLYIGGTGPVYFEHWQGDIAEMIVYARTLDDAERMKVEDYLADKYALTLNR